MSNNNKNILYCSFCGKSQHEVRKLIAGPTVFICDECVELCMDIIKEENKVIASPKHLMLKLQKNSIIYLMIMLLVRMRLKKFFL